VQATCGSFGWRHRLQATRAGAEAFHWERRERVLLRDIRRLGTATGQLSVRCSESGVSCDRAAHRGSRSSCAWSGSTSLSRAPHSAHKPWQSSSQTGLSGKPSTTARVDQVEAGSAAAVAGFQVGDVVTAIDGDAIGNFSDMQRIVGIRAGEQLTFAVKRGDATLQLHGTPQLREVKDPFGNVHRLGVLGITRKTSAGDVTTERVDPATAFWLGVKETWFVVDRTLAYIGGVFTGREAADQVGGPLRIAQISGQVATIGVAALVHLAAVLSISIGLLNLFPVPLLDGGHLLFYAVEAIRGRPMSERAQEMGFRIGLGLVLMLMVFATYNDILHLAGS